MDKEAFKQGMEGKSDRVGKAGTAAIRPLIDSAPKRIEDRVQIVKEVTGDGLDSSFSRAVMDATPPTSVNSDHPSDSTTVIAKRSIPSGVD